MADTERKKRRPLLLLIKLLLVVVVLGLGYKFGFGPLLTAKRNQPTELYVVNHTDKGYDLLFGWRRLERVLHPQSHVYLKLFVGMKETQTLTLTPEGGGTPSKTKVPLAPDQQLLINVDQATTYYVAEPERTHDQRLARLDLLRRELANRQPPKTLLALAQDLRTIATSAILSSTDDLIIDLAPYQPYLREVDAFSELLPAGARDKPLLTPEPLDLIFANGNLHLQPDQPDIVKATVTLGGPVDVNLGRTAIRMPADTELRIGARDGVTSLNAFVRSGLPVHYQDTDFIGSWTYQANHKPSGWSWAWAFSGSATIKGTDYSLALVFPHEGQPQAKLEKMEMP